MGVTSSLDEGGRIARERPGAFIVGTVAVFLVFDLVRKLFFFDVYVGSYRLLGGGVAAQQLITWLWQGIVVGIAYGLAGVGLSMTYSILGFANFSHGDYFTTGAFAGWAAAFVVAGLGEFDVGDLLLVGGGGQVNSADLGISILSTPGAIVLGLLVAGVFTIAVALLVDRLVYKPMRDQGAISLLIASIGVALVIRYLLNFVYGGGRPGLTNDVASWSFGTINGELVLAKSRSAFIVAANQGQAPEGSVHFSVPLLDFGDYTTRLIGVTAHELTLVITGIALMAGLHLLLQRTKLGTSMRAMADNKDLARVTGIPTERVIRDTWIIGAGLVGVAGYMFTLEAGTIFFRVGWEILLLVFAAVILGGIGSIYGAMAGGLAIGIVSEAALVWIPSSLTTAAAFAVMILMLLFKPDGLFGGVTTA
jgi:branched-chain amino acid transport system permease protein